MLCQLGGDRRLWPFCAENDINPSQPITMRIHIIHDDVIIWKHFPRYWPVVRGIHSSPVNSPHNGQWRGALMFSLICAWISGWVSNREAGDLRRHRANYDVIVMLFSLVFHLHWCVSFPCLCHLNLLGMYKGRKPPTVKYELINTSPKTPYVARSSPTKQR